MTYQSTRRVRGWLLSASVTTLWALSPLAPAQEPPASGATTAAPKAAAKTAAGKPAAAQGDKSAASYSLGVSMGQQLKSSGVGADQISSERLAAGVRDGLSGKASIGPADRANIEKMLRGAQDAQVEVNHRAAARFLAENAKKPDVVTTASGLQYKVITPGSGASPKASDTVEVNYKGSLLDGTEFDSSYKRGKPTSFPVGGVIPGWSEALQLMKPGAKYQLWLPPQLAYDTHSPGPIPPGSMLIFEVELLGIKPPAAAAPAAPGAAAPSSSAPPPK